MKREHDKWHAVRRERAEKSYREFLDMKDRLNEFALRMSLDQRGIVQESIRRIRYGIRNELNGLTYSDLNDRINERVRIAENIAGYADKDGKIWIQDGGRDCDMCESTSAPYPIPGGAFSYQHRLHMLYEWAEGPVWMWPVKPDQIEEAEYGSRDLALEAFEDGHPHVVSHVRYEEVA